MILKVPNLHGLLRIPDRTIDTNTNRMKHGKLEAVLQGATSTTYTEITSANMSTVTLEAFYDSGGSETVVPNGGLGFSLLGINEKRQYAKLRFTPAKDVNSNNLDDGDSGPQVEYTVTDSAESVNGTMKINIIPVNDAPEIEDSWKTQNQRITTSEDVVQYIVLTDNVNDPDGENDQLDFYITDITGLTNKGVLEYRSASGEAYQNVSDLLNDTQCAHDLVINDVNLNNPISNYVSAGTALKNDTLLINGAVFDNDAQALRFTPKLNFPNKKEQI